MKKFIAVLAQALVCASLLALPLKGFAEEAPANQEPAAVAEMDPQFEEQLAKEVENSSFELSNDMKQALHQIPEIEE